jgi:hypothetical protein
VRSGRESNYHQFGVRIAESGHGLAPIIVIEIRAALSDRNFFPVEDEPRTLSAFDNFRVNDF